MLIQALTDQFNAYLQDPHHDTIFWFDPEREYEALLPHLTGVPLWVFDGSLLHLRYRLIHRAAGVKTVVYLPLAQTEAETLRPFYATSHLFADRLYRFLRRQGLDFPDDPQVAHELRALLPRLAARSVGKGRAFWTYNLANLERARETLIGNFDDALLRFLSHPQEGLQSLRAEQLEGLFFAQLESAYGLSADADDAQAGDWPDQVAARLTAQLALVRAYVAAGAHADGFPYAAQLPAPLYFDRCRALLDRWQRDSLHKSSFIHLSAGLQTRYALDRWAAGLPLETGLTLGATWANVEAALWAQVEAATGVLESETDWRAWLAAHKAHFEQRAGQFWAFEGRAPGWSLLARAADLLTAIERVRSEIDRLGAPGDALRRYAASWWQIDRDFRVLREALDTQSTSYDRLREQCTRAYRDVLGRMNDRFSTLLQAEEAWPPRDALPPQSGFWASGPGRWPVPSQQAGPGRTAVPRVAVMYIDALRYELAQELLTALENEQAGERREIAARLAAIPTVTPIGMAALLPGGEHCRVDYDDDWQIAIPPFDRNLKDKAARQAWLQERLPGAVFYNLDEFLQTPSERIAEAQVIAVFDTMLDAVGETANTQAWNSFSALLRSVKRGVHKLLELGVGQVHVVADHGFLLLDQVQEHEKASVRSVPALAKKSRYVVGRDLGHTDQLRFVVPGSDGLIAWFPRGVGCFRTPGAYNYVHGGLSLQEVVVPHLVVTQQALGRPVGVRADLPGEIVNAQFKIRLEPVADSLLGQPRQVTLNLEKMGERVTPPLSCVVGPDGPVTLDVLLPLGCGLAPGDAVRWVLRDAATEEVLAEQEAVSRVDLW
ncbi:MAG: PglZ domain-containing protein [Anaerolineae bacterium]|nr:PglZ domain-containing protein [Anaerolineae bacterium]